MKYDNDISDQDIYEAMQDIEGYIDISIADFRRLYHHAYRHARERLLQSTLLSDIMTSDVLSIAAETTMEGIIETMSRRDISGLPVVDDRGRVCGVVSEKDIFKQLGGETDLTFWDLLANCLDINRCILRSVVDSKASEIMTSPAITLTPDDTAQRAVSSLTSHNINRLPIVDSKGLLAGIVTRSDLINSHLDLLTHLDREEQK